MGGGVEKFSGWLRNFRLGGVEEFFGGGGFSGGGEG